MEEVRFTIQAPPFSINKAYYLKSYSAKSSTKIRTKECREWGDSILVQLQQHLDQFKQFKELYAAKSCAISVSLVFFIPKEKFFTAKGEISTFSNDLTNVEKLLVDIIFDARFNGRQLGDIIVYNLDINDKYIVDLISKKRPSDSGYSIEVAVGLVSLPF